jgi:prefoldin subunit 5
MNGEEALERILRRMDELAEELRLTREELARVHKDFEKLTAKMPKQDPLENAIDSAIPAIVNLVRGKRRR